MNVTQPDLPDDPTLHIDWTEEEAPYFAELILAFYLEEKKRKKGKKPDDETA